MSIEMNMGDGKIEATAIDSGYGDEILETGWNPSLGLAPQEERAYAKNSQSASMPPNLTTKVIERFLRKMYSMQR
jgi:hypothetical protein